jgi:Glycosyl transferase family 2
VTIVIPAYNYADYVGEAIRSGLEQGYRPIEIIVVDDGSTDETPAVLRQFEGTIHTVRPERRGVSAARNVGLAEARGEFIVFLDADDLLVPGGIAAQVALMNDRPDIDAVFGGWYSYDVMSEVISRHHSSFRDDDVLPRLLRGSIVATPSAVMLRRAAVRALGGFDTSVSYTADWEMWFRLAKHGRRFGRVTASVATYRIHPRSMSSNLDLAIRDVNALLDRWFSDPALSPALRASEPQSRCEITMYLAGQCFQHGDDGRAAECVREALRWNPSAPDTLNFYACLAYGMSKVQKRSGGDIVERLRQMLALCEGLDDSDDERRSRRSALRHLAAAMIARNAGHGRLRWHHLRSAAAASWPTLLLPSYVPWTLRALLPRGMRTAARRVLGRLRLAPSVPALVRKRPAAGKEVGRRTATGR